MDNGDPQPRCLLQWRRRMCVGEEATEMEISSICDGDYWKSAADVRGGAKLWIFNNCDARGVQQRGSAGAKRGGKEKDGDTEGE
uniref:Uncharacterized protein n=1 Tax=Oryza barthii TaxID=65489 RepID=A0A0D3GM69_9ORYZ